MIWNHSWELFCFRWSEVGSCDNLVSFRLAAVRERQTGGLEANESRLVVQLHGPHARDLLRAAGGRPGAHVEVGGRLP
jgi:hypothetical protein